MFSTNICSCQLCKINPLQLKCFYHGLCLQGTKGYPNPVFPLLLTLMEVKMTTILLRRCICNRHLFFNIKKYFFIPRSSNVVRPLKTVLYCINFPLKPSFLSALLFRT